MIQISQCDNCVRKVVFSLNGRIMRKLSMLILRIIWIYTCYGSMRSMQESKSQCDKYGKECSVWFEWKNHEKLSMYSWDYVRVADVEQTLKRLWIE